jgi:hypothetical protein
MMKGIIMAKNKKEVKKVDYSMKYKYRDAVCFLYKNHLQIYRFDRTFTHKSKAKYKVYKSIEYDDDNEIIIEELTRTSLHIVRLIYDRDNDEEFSINMYMTYYRVDIEKIMNEGLLDGILDWIHTNIVCRTINLMGISSIEDSKKIFLETSKVFTVKTRSLEEIKKL